MESCALSFHTVRSLCCPVFVHMIWGVGMDLPEAFLLVKLVRLTIVSTQLRLVDKPLSGLQEFICNPVSDTDQIEARNVAWEWMHGFVV